MFDPVTTPLLIFVLGRLAEDIVGKACKDYLKDRLKSLFSWLGKSEQKDALQRAYEEAMKDAYAVVLEKLLSGMKLMGLANPELREYEDSLRKFIRDKDVAGELLESIKSPADVSVPSADVLRDQWKARDCRELPSDDLWPIVVGAFRNQAKERSFLSDPLREILTARNIDEIRALLEREGRVRPEVRLDKYASRMRLKYAAVDLANLMPAYAEEPGRLVIRDVFMPQHVRENPPPVEIPKDVFDRLREKGIEDLEGLDEDERENERLRAQIEKVRSAYVSQSPRPVLDVVAEPGNRLLVLTGEPGSGKTTLMRYLLLGVLEPPRDAKTDQPLPWTRAFQDFFPILIELRDFHAARQNDECDDFLEYALYMGKTEQYFLDDQWLHDRLASGRSLVMFDGLDEVFEGRDREKVMQEIAGFAQRYPKARIVVTSRPVGYREKTLREAGFRHYGIQDLDEKQIEAFTRGWFALTFPQQPKPAEQRIRRVLDSAQGSRSIRLLAGNPMLLTIMCLLAREQELPRERVAFYEKAVEVLCHHWDANRNLTLEGVDYLNVEDKKELLRRVAVRMQTGRGGLAGNFIHEEDLEDEIKTWFVERFQQPQYEAIKAARTMIDTLRIRNYILCLRAPRLYGFVHRTFLEYLTAAEYVLRFEKAKAMSIEELIDLFDKHCREPEWREVLRLICGQIDEQFAGQIIEHLAERTELDKWDRQTPLPELLLAIYCLSEARNVAKLERAGRSLIEKLIDFITKASPPSLSWSLSGEMIGGIGELVQKQIVEACREVPGTWSKRISLKEIALSQLEKMGDVGQSVWPEFVAAVDRNRNVALALTRADLPRVRVSAMRAVVRWWRDEDTRQLLQQRASDDESEYPRSAALQALGNNWADDRTRQFLTQRASNDEHEEPRGVALHALAQNWPDDQTRQFLTQRATDDEHSVPRSNALHALAQNWPDGDSQAFLRQLAKSDTEEQIRGMACSLLGGMHSRFGKILCTRDLDGVGLYLDPLGPIRRDHIEKAAKECGIDPADIDAKVAKLNQFLGWDITRGAKEKT